jgi:hypothetical protein
MHPAANLRSPCNTSAVDLAQTKPLGDSSLAAQKIDTRQQKTHRHHPMRSLDRTKFSRGDPYGLPEIPDRGAQLSHQILLQTHLGKTKQSQP